MKTILILGAGTGGTMIAAKLAKRLDTAEWKIIMVDKDETHYYQPGFLFIPFGVYQPADVIKPKKTFVPRSVEFVVSDIEIIEPAANQVKLTADGRVIHYDILIVATGTNIRPEEIEGLTDSGWRKNIFDFYTYEGSVALNKFLSKWSGGRLVVNVAEMPIKCPVAPLEFIFLADWYFQKRGIRNKVDIIYATPLPGAFTKPRASAVFGDMMKKKGIQVVPDFAISEVDNGSQVIRSYDGREVGYDLFVTIPTNMGADVIDRSGLGNELNYVPVDKHTMQAKAWQNIFVIGDASDSPASKAGAVAHFMGEIVLENILAFIAGHPVTHQYDGHANCFIETGFNKAALIDFNFDQEPVPGTYPLPVVGPMSLLKETSINHFGKLAFRWMYWNLLLRDGFMPFPSKMSMVGKQI